MDRLLDILIAGFDLLLVVLGFSAIIVIHEAGHFFAARWAKIRVLAFAVGFGPALVSYRRGLGFRKGSSEKEYQQLEKGAQELGGERRESARDALTGRVSPTEYRLNALPFGGYVKMLGQDDADPGAQSDEPDSYNNCVPWKRMVVISAGVVFNIITAAILFIIVFNPAVGLRQEPARIGRVLDTDRPAALAVALNGPAQGVREPGLRPGDTIESINGERPSHFQDFATAVAMSRKGVPIDLRVRREGVPEPLHFEITPKPDEDSGLLSIGAGPMASGTIVSGNRRYNAKLQSEMLDPLGFSALRPGARLVKVDGRPATSPYDIDNAVDASSGRSVIATFELPAERGVTGPLVDITLQPRPELPSVQTLIETDSKPLAVHQRHVLGLTPLLAVVAVQKDSPAEKGGLRPGDVFKRVGAVEWPSKTTGMEAIRATKDKDIAIDVMRKDTDGAWKAVSLGNLHTRKAGELGFTPDDSAATWNGVGAWVGPKDGATPRGGALPGLVPGSRIVAAGGTPTPTLGEVRNALKRFVAESPNSPITLSVELPGAAGTGKVEQIVWPLTTDDAATLARLGWENPMEGRVGFEPERFLWRADSILGAIPMGLHETRRVMTNTYLTFARLFQGSVEVKHLKGPVGIAHVGVAIADRGFTWLLFFMALISVNLAVINFLPMPIADGGHMVFLIYEQITGRPPSPRFVNAAAVCGLVLIGTLFLVVTFHDVTDVFRDVARFFKT